MQSNTLSPPRQVPSKNGKHNSAAPILGRLENVHEISSEWEARCPAHEDQRASLSISIGDDGRTLLHCHAGCPTEEIVGKLG